jgi:hypothetical protein
MLLQPLEKIEKGIHKTRWDALFGNLAWQSNMHMFARTQRNNIRELRFSGQPGQNCADRYPIEVK